MQSLHSFCTQYDIPKTTVKRWLNDNGFDTSQGMTPDAVAAAKAHFRIEEPQPEPTITPEIVVGNHRGQLALPSQPTQIDLANYRGEHAALRSFQPEDIRRFLESCDGFLDVAARKRCDLGLTLTDNGEGTGLTLFDNGLRLNDNGSQTVSSAHIN